jgi:hypothetical protein
MSVDRARPKYRLGMSVPEGGVLVDYSHSIANDYVVVLIR